MKRIICLGIFLINTLAVNATHFELTYVTSLIHPIGISTGADLLCWTQFESNSHGGTMISPITYGWLIIHGDGTWEEIPYVTAGYKDGIYVENDPVYAENKAWGESIKQGLALDPLPEILEVLVNTYEFSNERLDLFFKNEDYSFRDPGLQQCDIQQRTLLDHYSTMQAGEKIHSFFRFGDLIFVQNHLPHVLNEKNAEGNTNKFDYPGEKWGYATYDITGVIDLRSPASRQNLVHLAETEQKILATLPADRDQVFDLTYVYPLGWSKTGGDLSYLKVDPQAGQYGALLFILKNLITDEIEFNNRIYLDAATSKMIIKESPRARLTGVTTAFRQMEQSADAIMAAYKVQFHKDFVFRDGSIPCKYGQEVTISVEQSFLYGNSGFRNYTIKATHSRLGEKELASGKLNGSVTYQGYFISPHEERAAVLISRRVPISEGELRIDFDFIGCDLNNGFK